MSAALCLKNTSRILTRSSLGSSEVGSVVDPEALRKLQRAESTVLKVEGRNVTKRCVCGTEFVTKKDQAHCSWDCWVNGPHRLWRRVEINGADECWPYMGARTWRGYGVYSYNGKSLNAHRAAYILTFGDVGPDVYICHTCDNPICCNPNHLFPGSPDDNMQDKMRKGRHDCPKGEAHYRCKLTESNVRDIRRLWDGGMMLKDIARIYQVSTHVIQKVTSRTTWKHVA